MAEPIKIPPDELKGSQFLNLVFCPTLCHMHDYFKELQTPNKRLQIVENFSKCFMYFYTKKNPCLHLSPSHMFLNIFDDMLSFIICCPCSLLLTKWANLELIPWTFQGKMNSWTFQGQLCLPLKQTLRRGRERKRENETRGETVPATH